MTVRTGGAAAPVNTWAKRRLVAQPYAVFTSGEWEWRVLKAYQTAEKERTNRYAKWFCAVRSPFTNGGWEYGDTYITGIPGAEAGRRE